MRVSKMLVHVLNCIVALYCFLLTDIFKEAYVNYCRISAVRLVNIYNGTMQLQVFSFELCSFKLYHHVLWYIISQKQIYADLFNTIL